MSCPVDVRVLSQGFPVDVRVPAKLMLLNILVVSEKPLKVTSMSLIAECFFSKLCNLFVDILVAALLVVDTVCFMI